VKVTESVWGPALRMAPDEFYFVVDSTFVAGVDSMIYFFQLFNVLREKDIPGSLAIAQGMCSVCQCTKSTRLFPPGIRYEPTTHRAGFEPSSRRAMPQGERCPQPAQSYRPNQLSHGANVDRFVEIKEVFMDR